jgi:hypothetical protein
MDAEVDLEEAALDAVHPTEPFDGAVSAPLKIHHFTVYGRVARNKLAAFAAAKVQFESAVRGSRNYVARTMTDKRARVEEAQAALATTVTLGPKREGDLPGGPGQEGLPRRGTCFTAVNGSIIHCVRTSPA